MHITGIEAIPLEIPFVRPFRLSKGVITHSRPVVVIVHTSDGLSGLGEVPARPEIDPECQESALALILGVLAPALEGMDALDVDAAYARMGRAASGRPMVKAAIEIALLDIAARAAGLPVCELLGSKRRDRIEVGQTIGIEDRETTARHVDELVEIGFRSIKLKIGVDVGEDIARVQAAREAVGATFSLRADANEGYSLESAMLALREMESSHLLYVEQPVRRGDLRGLAALTAALETPICADESVDRPWHAAIAFQHRVCDVINIKLFRAGGMRPALQIAKLAERSSIDITLGSMVEHGIGTAAGAHLGATLTSLHLPCDVKGPSMFVDDFVQPPIRIEGGYTHVPTGPGLGVTLDHDKVRHYRVN